jgi:uncharacterized protein (TIGR02145 family)
MKTLKLYALKTAALCLTAICVSCKTAPSDTEFKFTDDRDGKMYRIVRIGSQVWMAENLNYQTVGSWCYDDDTSNCAKYGRLYTWDAAMAACPASWHLPSREEWDKLVAFVGGIDSAGTKLKSKSPDWDGTDDYEFSAMPGGYRGFTIIDGSLFCRHLGSKGFWWTTMNYDGYVAGLLLIVTDLTRIDWVGGSISGRPPPIHRSIAPKVNPEGIGISVRCLLD